MATLYETDLQLAG